MITLGQSACGIAGALPSRLQVCLSACLPACLPLPCRTQLPELRMQDSCCLRDSSAPMLLSWLVLPAGLGGQAAHEPPGSTQRIMLCLPSAQSQVAPVHLQDSAAKLRKQDREGGKNRSWRREYRLLTQQVVALEEDEKALEVVYPQVCSWIHLKFCH